MWCFVYATCYHSDILGPRMDIHTGGADLKFPHHDNEIAQAEVCVSAATPHHMATTFSSHGNDLLSHDNDLLVTWQRSPVT